MLIRPIRAADAFVVESMANPTMLAQPRVAWRLDSEELSVLLRRVDGRRDLLRVHVVVGGLVRVLLLGRRQCGRCDRHLDSVKVEFPHRQWLHTCTRGERRMPHHRWRRRLHAWAMDTARIGKTLDGHEALAHLVGDLWSWLQTQLVHGWAGRPRMALAEARLWLVHASRRALQTWRTVDGGLDGWRPRAHEQPRPSRLVRPAKIAPLILVGEAGSGAHLCGDAPVHLLAAEQRLELRHQRLELLVADLSLWSQLDAHA